jgi:hypothetical protein
VAGMGAHIVDRLSLSQEFDRAIDAAGHGDLLRSGRSDLIAEPRRSL